MKFNFKQYFLNIFCEDPSMATYAKKTWKQCDIRPEWTKMKMQQFRVLAANLPNWRF